MRIVQLSGPGAPLLDPDIVWDGVVGDLAITAPDDPVNPAGLRATQALATAVLICLMTDIRVDTSELPPGETNRGWPGDGFDLEPAETQLGSKLWLLRRRSLTGDIERLAEDYARQAMQTLIDQGAFVRVDVKASADRSRSRLDLLVEGFGRDGRKVFDQKYGVLWDQLNGVSAPLAP